MLRHHPHLIGIGLLSFMFIASFGVANAYALPGTASAPAPYATSSFYYGGWNTAPWQDLSVPFQNFTQSLQSVGNTNFSIPMPPAAPNLSDAAARTAHGLFEQFDAWLAGVTGGFHIAQILTLFLQLMSWILGLVKSGIDWALSWIH